MAGAFLADCGALRAGEDVLGGLEGFGLDDRGVRLLFGPDPFAGVVPAHLRFMTQGDVFDIEEDFVASLFVPDLPARVAGVPQDGPHRDFRPCAAASLAVLVAGRVVRGRRKDVVAGEAFGDRVGAFAGEEFGEDPLYDTRGGRIGFEPMQSLANGGSRWVRMRPRVCEHIAVRWPSAKEAALHCGLGCHCGADAGLDPVAFTLAHTTVEAHHKVVGIRAGVDGTADLRYPQLDVVVHEHGERESELAAVERALRLADHDAVEPAIPFAKRLQEPRGFGSAFPGQRA